jgi:hypothetical protein
MGRAPQGSVITWTGNCPLKCLIIMGASLVVFTMTLGGHLRFTVEPDETKFKELVLYISAKSQNDPKFGRTKLNKILFYSDFMAFRMYNRPITGVEYRALENGPVPKRMIPILDQLKESGALVEHETRYFERQQIRQLALRPADLSVFSATEIALVDQVIDDLREHNATEVSELSHKFPGWKAAIAGEESIPYEMAYTSSPVDESPENPELIRNLLRIAGEMGAFGFEESAESPRL